ncbi:hypothetical protein M8C21_020378 [Ambrosia artemisiifolia]|uniref:Uncharacterized protein n=1 Tax=Ambrosia artemisiifolia TaxID=4212 RepID=A0AAD5BW25_AMBAR|nr:hypothetical protein M8C21_020378 [Ambrosia artemisiifolia]
MYREMSIVSYLNFMFMISIHGISLMQERFVEEILSSGSFSFLGKKKKLEGVDHPVAQVPATGRQLDLQVSFTRQVIGSLGSKEAWCSTMVELLPGRRLNGK